MRALRILLIIGSILAIVLVVADRVLVNFAEDEAASRVNTRLGLGGHTSVTIRGFPFLTQAMSKNLDAVDLKLTGVTAEEAELGQIMISEFSATLEDVRIGSGYDSAVAGTAEGTALIGYDQFDQKTGDTLTFTYADNGRVRAKGAVEVAGEKIDVDTFAEIKAEGNAITLQAVATEEQPTSALDAINTTYVVKGLPAGLRLTEARAGANGVTVGVTGENVALVG
ncbi:hypothetical protein SRB5_32490 [Streptomyces sp. RB5]|uniref:DUF2993 domain-containing protein n=1 Tax=Streptomyces smaragdinus TaxID=2585196 RepID=A0A7K0CI05_9ACTN|nr:DUF2993 domain-containing protein [Streptomyces smaragdinus]MQY13108.1 hypothetical protein [Streptomyces smaragdinus]